MATSYVLGEHAEKIVAAITLKTLQANHSAVTETAMKYIVAEKPSGGLTYQDLFFREVTKFHQIIQVLSKKSEDLVHSDRQPQEVASMIAEANTVILAVLREVIQFRQKKADVFSPNSQRSVGFNEYLPWTAATGKGGLRDALLLQQNLTLRYGARSTSDTSFKNNLYDQLMHLVDIILDGQKCYLESIRGTEKFDILFQQYETERHAIIEPFCKYEEFERAAILAEKYCDFQILVQISELTDNRERLDRYMEKFSEQDFSQFLFGWYIREQKQGRLLQQFRSTKRPRTHQQALSQFLVDHPSLSWLQNVFNGDYKQANNTLRDLAKKESELLQRKKTMLSLAKLALLASDEHPQNVEEEVSAMNRDLDLVVYQEELPEVVLSSYGYDIERLRVLTPTELVKLYICDENSTATEYDFKKALELLAFIEDEFERSELRHKVWCQAVLRDTWTDTDSNSPLEVIQGLTFFRLADLMACLGLLTPGLLTPGLLTPGLLTPVVWPKLYLRNGWQCEQHYSSGLSTGILDINIQRMHEVFVNPGCDTASTDNQIPTFQSTLNADPQRTESSHCYKNPKIQTSAGTSELIIRGINGTTRDPLFRNHGLMVTGFEVDGDEKVHEMNNIARANPLSVLKCTNITWLYRACASTIAETIEQLVKKNKVVIFMKGVPEEPRCGFSNAVVQILRMHGVTYDAHDVLKDEELRKGIKAYSNWPTIPQVFIGGEFVGGCDIMLQMHQNGELVEELRKAGIRSALLDKEQQTSKTEDTK
ncbi:hypothetical protein Cfor_12358 [Coptotermes formosanus]|uniref:Glutaredoxin-related protein 5, mitochondrial n=1 Tax=Coptotermes formosanus TaxID=36987 RepID=A0A6L2PJ73_COPFO|nr:hypothetical protein Cfor_12358 [Coptotermes formosanus]